MPTPQGTRQKNGYTSSHPAGGSQTRSLERDPGMSKLVTARMTFGSGQVTAANGTFVAFAVNDPILVEGVNINNGYFTVLGIDATNEAFLTLDPPPRGEGPINAIVRTP